jgi:REP element-mobilizing transposase RayT
MENSLFKVKRKSVMELGEIYFWTATIHKWIPLLQTDSAKDMILNSLKYLSTKDKIDVYAFVIMPNHIHLIWRLKELNGKELPHTSFLKFTAHEIKVKLIKTPEELSRFYVAESNKEFKFWQRDSLAVKLNSREMAF